MKLKRLTLSDICILFARHFSNVYSGTLERESDLPFFDFNMSLPPILCSSGEVKKKLDALDIHKGCGPDRIPPAVLRQCSDLLCGPLACLFNQSLQDDIFPSFLVPIVTRAYF